MSEFGLLCLTFTRILYCSTTVLLRPNRMKSPRLIFFRQIPQIAINQEKITGGVSGKPV